MIKEFYCEKIKTSDGESGTINHYIMTSDDDASSLPSDAPLGSDAISKTAVYIKYPDGWSQF